MLNTLNSNFGYNKIFPGVYISEWKHTEKTGKKMTQAQLGNTKWLGKKRKKESIDKMRQTVISLYGDNRKIILQYDLQGNFIKEYPSISSTKKSGFTISAVSEV